MKKNLLLVALFTAFAQQGNAQIDTLKIKEVKSQTFIEVTQPNVEEDTVIMSDSTASVYVKADIDTLQSTSKKGDDYGFYRKAYSFYQKKNYSKTIIFIDKAIDLNPQDIEYYSLKAYTLAYQKDYKNAIKTIDLALKMDSDDAELYEIKANSLSLLNKNEEAIPVYEIMLNLEKNHARYYNNYMSALKDMKKYDKLKEVYKTYLNAMESGNSAMKQNEQFADDIHFYTSLAYYYTGDIKETLKLLNKAIAISPNYAGYYNNRANIFNDQKKYTDALTDFNKAISLDPKEATAYFNRGTTYLDIEKYDEALKDFKLAEKLGYKEDKFYQNLGNAYKNLEKYDEALTAYKKAIEINPDNKEILNNLAILYKKMGKKAESNQAYDQAIASGVKTHIPLYNKGFDLMLKKDYQTAIPLLEKAIVENPNFIEAYNQLGICYDETEKDSLALETFTKGISIDKNYTILYHNRANIYKKMGNFEAAKQDHLTALKLDPSKTEEYYSLAAMYMKLNDAKSAQQYFDLATQSGVSNVEYYIDYTSFLSRNKQYAKATAISEKGIKQYPENYDLLINLAATYSNQAEEEKNAKTLKKAILIDPEKAEAYYNLGNYYLLAKKDLENAEKNYLISIEKNANLMQAYLNLAVVYQDMGNDSKVMKTMNNLIQKFPDYYEAYYNRAEYLYRKGKTKEAIADFEKSFELMDSKINNKKNETYTINIEKSNKSLLKAQAYQMMGKYDKSIPAFQSYLAFNTKDDSALSNYGYCLIEAGKPDEALDNFEKAHQLNKDEIDSMLGLVVTNYLLGNKTNMKKYIREIEKTFPEYRVDQELPYVLTKEGYFYTPKFLKIWNDTLQK